MSDCSSAMPAECTAFLEGGRPTASVIKKGEKQSHKIYDSKKHKGCKLDKNALSLGIGLFLIFTAILLQFFWDELVMEIINKVFILTETSRSYELWSKTVVPVHISFYFFNWTNPTDIKSSSYKPVFEEVGPYVFREDSKKVDLVWNDNGTVTYKKLPRWYFVPERSRGLLNDSITTLNVVAVTAARATRNWLPFARAPLSMAMGATQKLHVTKGAGEYLFEGYQDPLIDMIYHIPGLSSMAPFDRFGWFYKRNGSTDFDGIFNMETGSNGLDKFGNLKFWNYKNSTSYYEGQCSLIKGSTGDVWPSKRTKQEDLYMFNPDICRYVRFAFREESSVNGVHGYLYDTGASFFDNGTVDPANKCFCGEECVPSGLVDVSRCRYGIPGFLSYPHFHLADPSYREAVVGMNPDPKKHETYMVLEPNLGITLDLVARLQVNVLLQREPHIRLLREAPKIFFPMLWFEHRVTVPKDLVFEIKMLLAVPILLMIVFVILYVVGVSFVLMYVTQKWLAKARYMTKKIRLAKARGKLQDETAINTSYKK